MVVQLAIRDVDKTRNGPRGRAAIFTAALVVRKCAHGKTDRHRAMVVESRASVLVRSNPSSSSTAPRLGDEPGPTPASVAPFVGIGQRPPAGGSPSMRGPRGRSRCRAGFPGRSAAKAMDRYCSAQESVRTEVSPPYRSTGRESSPWQEVQAERTGSCRCSEHLLGETPKSAPSNSNRHHAFSLQTPQKSWLSKPAPLS